MEKKLRIYVSTPIGENLTERQQKFFDAVIGKVNGAGFQVCGFHAPGASHGLDWGLSGVRDLMNQCQGAIAFAFGRWEVSGPTAGPPFQESRQVATEYNHLEGGFALAKSKPLLVITEYPLMQKGVCDETISGQVVRIPPDADVDWLDKSIKFTGAFDNWQRKVRKYRHVFLGYSGSKGANTANKIALHLNDLGYKVLDWQRHFQGGESILQQISEAARLCSCGIFIFTADDTLVSGEGTEQGAPRDNVVFEAGYFAGAKGKQRTLIILQEGAKFPVDLGGDIYLPLREVGEIGPIENKLRLFMEKVLGTEPP